MGKLFTTSDKLVDFALEPKVKSKPFSEIELMIQLNDHIPYERFKNVDRRDFKKRTS